MANGFKKLGAVFDYTTHVLGWTPSPYQQPWSVGGVPQMYIGLNVPLPARSGPGLEEIRVYGNFVEFVYTQIHDGMGNTLRWDVAAKFRFTLPAGIYDTNGFYWEKAGRNSVIGAIRDELGTVVNMTSPDNVYQPPETFYTGDGWKFDSIIPNVPSQVHLATPTGTSLTTTNNQKPVISGIVDGASGEDGVRLFVHIIQTQGGIQKTWIYRTDFLDDTGVWSVNLAGGTFEGSTGLNTGPIMPGLVACRSTQLI